MSVLPYIAAVGAAALTGLLVVGAAIAAMAPAARRRAARHGRVPR